MTDYFRDVWFELRERRLWPIAVALALALVAVPVLLLEHGDEKPAPVAQTPPAEVQDNLRKVAVLANEPSSRGSDLGVFDKKDPFKPRTRKLRSLRQIAAQTGITASPDAGQGGGPGGGASPGPGASGTGSGASGGASGGGSAGGPSPGAGSPGRDGGGGRSKPGRRRTTSYTYVADVTFGREGRTRRIRSLRRLEMLPEADNPLLVFLGVDTRGGNAVFLVDSTLEQRGEGKCADKACSVLSIGPGAEHSFIDEDGREYLLRINHIRRVRAASTSASASRRGAAGPSASAASESRSGDRGRALVSSLLVDVQTVASDAAEGSRAGDGRR